MQRLLCDNSAFVAGLSGTNKPTPIVSVSGPNSAETTNFVPVDNNGIVFARTTTQILDIVYLGSSTKPGRMLCPCLA